MRQIQVCGGVFAATAVALWATQPVVAASQVSAIRFNQQGSELELKLETKGGNEPPQIFAVNQGNVLVADLVNTQLSLPQGTNFRKTNPLPNISAVAVKELDDNRVRVTIRGTDKLPISSLIQRDPQGITLGIDTTTENQGILPIQDSSVMKLAQFPNRGTNAETEQMEKPAELSEPEPEPEANPSETPEPPEIVAPEPDVLVPEPEIIIDGIPAAPANAVQPIAPAPPFLPRAVAPPVGDIAVSNINAAASTIDLGTATLVPRLVLREAPIREVLSLLARSAGLNLAFAESDEDSGAAQFTISIDLENEPVQDAFNYILQLSGLQANRRGSTIFVGAKLPQAARNLISRTLRLNQASVQGAATFLATQGAEVQQVVIETEEIIDPETQRVVRQIERPPEIRAITSEQEDGSQGALLLRGLAVSTDDRLNSISLVGEPRQIEIATSLLKQLDARRRQVAVNVKIIDVNLAGTDAYNASFSFGINDTFVVSDGGAAAVNFGRVNPPSRNTVVDSQIPTVTEFQFSDPEGDGDIFLERQNAPFDNLIEGFNESAGTPAVFARPGFGRNNNPFQPGLAEVDVQDDGVDFGFALPSLFEFPDKFLLTLQAQITSNNAKILTDPTLVIQEGQEASVRLVQEVLTSVRTDIDTDGGATTRTITPVIEEAGLVLTVNVERIDDNGFITLSTAPSITAPSGTQDFNSDNAQNTITFLSRRELSSGLVRLRDGQTLILSGIIQDTDRTTVSKVPILGDIPLLGALFRSTDKQNQRTEVIILVTPQIMDDTDRNGGYGYSYTPGRDARQMLNRGGFQSPGN
ncbi:MAG: AMIN domain-containing protein [Moorea sp. SIO1F2]|uniref:AMIN domain-containing protein n=1 Tax=Moorena sp. SIO1F2 TaxID=2607819 RepID=UPI0013B6F89E|nr:AMIN domain-containing protein [Moorena sp. SIO1F2]NET81928.1 AMIN domain-containing protein [Moorena sp. SIO1F2]